jgi:hypothetical protein
MGCSIARRDFVGGALVSAGAAALAAPASSSGQQAPGGPLFNINASDAEAFNGPPGVDDYALSNGNVWSVVASAHRIRDGAYQQPDYRLHETQEVYDLVIVGGGAAGIGGAFYFHREAKGFDPARDIAGITINRWGHAYVVPEPGFNFGDPMPSKVLTSMLSQI